jgi:hypothetical protein
LWKSNLNDIPGDHTSENYEVNMWGKYCRIYPEFAPKKPQQQCFIKGTTNIQTLTDSPTQNEKQVL